jgi:large subunit ribosomal protein L3
MISGFIAKKGRMTSIFDEQNRRVSVTVCHAEPLTVTQIKNLKKDKYEAIQVAFGKKKNKKEFKKISTDEIAIDSQISIDDVFTKGDSVSVTGRTKGRGYAGVIKRHGFSQQPVTRGASTYVRHPGSIGAQTPGKVVKGKKMPGHMGNINKTVKGLKVFSVNKDTNEVSICGSIPGVINSWVIISKK